MSDLEFRLKLAAPASRVYEAIRDGSKWWTRFAQIDNAIGGVSRFRFPRAGFYAAMKTVATEPGRLVEWECVEQAHAQDSGFVDLHDWQGTRVRFALEPDGEDRCVLHFTHVGLTPRLECHDTCKSAWSFYLNESLRGYVEQDRGQPFSDDSEDNIIPAS